ncbi:MAG: metallophosphoesterase [Lachnospiraceae bacterium]|nr:metallophosphoesterase [Lachnospiraceae bacterium]
MRFKKYIPFLFYLLLLLGCLAIVMTVGRLAGTQEGDPEASSDSSLSGEDGFPEPGGQPEPERQPEPEAPLPEGEGTETPGRPRQPDRDSWHLDEWPDETETVPDQEPYRPPAVMLASDLHYISRATHDGGTAFQEMVAQDDGKISEFSDELIDTLVEEAVISKPSALVLTGDITLNGERENHQRLAEKLRRAFREGVPVLVVPGNHDIKNRNAASYFGEEREEAQYLESAQDFYDIYHEFGYDQAISRDESSLSYLYALDKTHWILMLDTCRYEDYNHVSGRVKPETMEWLEGWLIQAREEGITVLPAGHHNLLSESRLYTTECTMENHRDVIGLFETYGLPLYVSGHLHAQRIKKHKPEPGTAEDAYGIQEIVLPPYSIPPCQYGWLEWQADGGMQFRTRQADVEGHARRMGSGDGRLLRFKEYGAEYMKGIVGNQARKTLKAIPEDLKEEMAGLYGELYYAYCAGNGMSQDRIQATRAYRLWERIAPDSRYVKDMGQMIEDVRQDLHDWRK